MAKLAYDVGDKETASSLGKRILSLSPNDADVLSMVGWLEYDAGQLECASLSSFCLDFRSSSLVLARAMLYCRFSILCHLHLIILCLDWNIYVFEFFSFALFYCWLWFFLRLSATVFRLINISSSRTVVHAAGGGQ